MKESELCELLRIEAEQHGFKYFPEYQNWDAVLIRNNAIFGIQAKVDMKAKAIAQTIKATGVHYKVVVTDNYRMKIGDDWSVITNALKIIHLTHFNNSFHLVNNVNTFNPRWLLKFRFRPRKLITIPDFQYYTPSGVPSPRLVTERNIAFVRLELLALEKGFVTHADAKSLGLERVPRYFFDYEWRTKRWLLKPVKLRPSDSYPHIYQGLIRK